MEQSNSPQPLFCPYTGQQTIGQSRKEFTIPNGRVIWWHCTGCCGWHLIIDNPLSEVSTLTSDNAAEDTSPSPGSNQAVSKFLNRLQLLS